MTTIFLTTHSTAPIVGDSRFLDWQQPDGIWSTEHRALAGMRRATAPDATGFGVDIRAVQTDTGIIDRDGVTSNIVVGSYTDVLGDMRMGRLPQIRTAATAEQLAELHRLETELGVSAARHMDEEWARELEAARTARFSIDFPTIVWLVLSPTLRYAGGVRQVTVAGAFNSVSLLHESLDRFSHEQPGARKYLTCVPVLTDSPLDLDHLIRTRDHMADDTAPDSSASVEHARYAALCDQLGIVPAVR